MTQYDAWTVSANSLCPVAVDMNHGPIDCASGDTISNEYAESLLGDDRPEKQKGYMEVRYESVTRSIWRE